MLLIMLYTFLWLIPFVASHITWIYPSPRVLPLDFLDNRRTIKPCGMEKPDIAKYSTFAVGRSYTFMWHLANSHKGGVRVTLLNETGELLRQLYPNMLENSFTNDNETTESAIIRFEEPCARCVVRVERQALQYDNYIFHSCADVNVLNAPSSDDDDCSGNGGIENGVCRCNKYFTGDHCQIRNLCDSHDDCLNGGKCIEESRNYIPKSCYCSIGYFGSSCERTFETKPLDDSCFNYYYPSDKEKYGNYGLFNEQCFHSRNFNEKDIVYFRVVEDELEIIMDYESNSWIAMGWKPLYLRNTCRSYPNLTQPHRHRKPASQNRNELEALKSGYLLEAFEAPLHPMDCIDIVVGSIVDGRSQITDKYSRDRSTPLDDTWLDGENSLVAAYGIQQDGRSIIMFRRAIEEKEPSDHPLGPGKIVVLYAKGTDPKHIPAENQREKDFYKLNLFNYHGKSAASRGVGVIEFVAIKSGKEQVSLRPDTNATFTAKSNTAQHQDLDEQPVPEPSGEPLPEPDVESYTEHGRIASSEPNLGSVVEPQSESGSKFLPELSAELLPEPNPEALPEPSPESLPEPNPEALPEPIAELLPEPNPEALPEPSAEPLPEPSAEPLPEPSAELISGHSSELLSEPTVDSLPEPGLKPLPEPDSKSQSEIDGELHFDSDHGQNLPAYVKSHELKQLASSSPEPISELNIQITSEGISNSKNISNFEQSNCSDLINDPSAKSHSKFRPQARDGSNRIQIPNFLLIVLSIIVVTNVRNFLVIHR